MKQTLVATTLFGLEKTLGEEIDSLGFERIETMDGRITYTGDERAVARSNIFLSQCERVFILAGKFPCDSFSSLFDGVSALPWEEYIGRNDAFPVTGHAIRSTLFSVPDCQKIIKKAIVNRLSSRYGISQLPEDSGLTVRIEFFIFKDVASIMIDTSGHPLHKRGYRPAANAAPIRETLAMALVKTARLSPDTLLWDPMCGSGTIPIEAARAMCKIAPGIRSSFAGEDFFFVDEDSWALAREEARDIVDMSVPFEAFASDIDSEAVELAKANAQRAGVSSKIRFSVSDVRRIRKPDRRGTIICNPPYGERLMSEDEVRSLYRDMGRAFSHFDPWHVYVISGYSDFERCFGRTADKKRKLYNGMIPCTLYQYFKPRNDFSRSSSYQKDKKKKF